MSVTMTIVICVLVVALFILTLVYGHIRFNDGCKYGHKQGWTQGYRKGVDDAVHRLEASVEGIFGKPIENGSVTEEDKQV